jgi:hypothetical protein
VGVSGHAFVARLKRSFARNKVGANSFSTHEGSASLDASTMAKANAAIVSIAATGMMKRIVRLYGLSIILWSPTSLARSCSAA